MAHALCRLIIFGIVVAIVAPSSAAESIAITEFMADPSGSSTTDEWVELYNFGGTAQTLSGWRLKDDDTDNVVIPTVTMQPGQFLIIARNKAGFEALWTGGVPNPRVVQYTGTFALSDGTSSTGDEIVLLNASSQEVWRMGYGPGDYNGRGVFYALTDLSTTNTDHGGETSSTWININGNDLATGRLDYEGNQFREDPWARYASNVLDYGSPLAGAYTGAQNPPAPPTSYSLNLSQAGIPINPGVRGLAIADQSLDRGDNSDKTGVIPCLERVTGSSLRGVAGGLYADLYDWKRRNGMPRPTTLEFLRYARDTSSTLYVTANIRGLTEPDPNQPGFRRYYTSDTQVLAQLAADWVRYTNHIVPTYRQGDTITDARDAAILSELTWSSSYVNGYGTADNFTTLTAPGEPAVPKVTWWEIGNEPTVSLANAYSVTNGFTFTSNPAEYGARYAAITAAMLAEDPTIKVGPCVVNGRAGNNAAMITAVLQTSAQVDFISYHPYGSMGDFPTQVIRQQGYLSGVHAEQVRFLNEIKALVATYRPAQVATMRYVASETNVSDFRTNNQFQEGTQVHAIGSVETIFSFARLGLDAAHYWIWITATPTYLADTNRFAVSMAWEKMRDELDDRLLGSFDANPKIRVHVTKDSASGDVKLWVMNFSDSQDLPLHLNLTGGPAPSGTQVIHTALRNKEGGPTSLFSVNLNPEINFGVPRRDVEWSTPQTANGTDISNWNITVPAATLNLYTIKDISASSVRDWTLY